MEQCGSSQRTRRRNSRHAQDAKQTLEMRKTGSKNKRKLADTYCQTVTMQLKIEENVTEEPSDGKRMQTETGNSWNQPTPMYLAPTNEILGTPTELGDPPLLRQPQYTTMTGIQQIIECFRSGTVQAKLTLLKEVETIFECQLCRSLFRCLPNLLEHRRLYCLSRQPEPDDPSQVMKDLLEAVFPQRNQEETSPVSTTPGPVHQDHPNSQQQTSVPQKLCYREPIVVLRRFQHPPALPYKVVPVSQKAGGIVQVEINGKEVSLSDAQDTIGSTELKQPEGNLERDTVSPSNLKEQRSPSHKASRVKVGERKRGEGNIEPVLTPKKLFCCTVCKQLFNSPRMLTKHMNTDHNTRTLLKDSLNKGKTKFTPGYMKGNGEAYEGLLSSVGKKCHVCKKSLQKEENVHCQCNEVCHDLNTATQQDCATSASHLSTRTTPVPQPSSKPVNESPSSQESVHLNNVGSDLWIKDLFGCGLCKRRYSSKVVLIKHMSFAHKFFVLEKSRSPPSRKAKTKVEHTEKAFDNVRVYCWFCGKKFLSRCRVRSHCRKSHRQKLQEIHMLMNEGAGPNIPVHELISLRDGFAASPKHPTPSFPAK
ncbi:hypothetical protein NFI96_031077 [Prochilodus magdalenae]|nr:hypothetical protein NFI96_031077 [Prochilodus magdalenae]